MSRACPLKLSKATQQNYFFFAYFIIATPKSTKKPQLFMNYEEQQKSRKIRLTSLKDTEWL